jgi:hypothetical protein
VIQLRILQSDLLLAMEQFSEHAVYIEH